MITTLFFVLAMVVLSFALWFGATVTIEKVTIRKPKRVGTRK